MWVGPREIWNRAQRAYTAGGQIHWHRIEKERALDDRAIRSVREQCVEVATFPQPRLLVELEAGLGGQELLGVKLAAAVLDPDVVDLVEHLVEDDPRHEEPWHERTVERAVDADQA